MILHDDHYNRETNHHQGRNNDQTDGGGNQGVLSARPQSQEASLDSWKCRIAPESIAVCKILTCYKMISENIK